MGDRRCCCDCWTWEDDFNRSNSTTVTGWNEVTGDWEILDSELHEKAGGGGTSNARIHATTYVPARSAGQMHIWVTVVDPNTDDVFFIWPACDSTTAVGALKVKYTYLGSLEWEVEVISSSGSEGSIQMTSAPIAEGKHQIWVCVDNFVTGHEMIKAGVVTVADEPLWLEVDAGDGQYFAIGHDNSTNGAYFDDFSVTEMRKGSVECDNCFCWCLARPAPKTLTASFTDATDRASCLSGQSFEMEADWIDSTFKWYGEITIPAGDHGTETELQFLLTCVSSNDDDPDWPGRNFTLDFFNDTCCVANSNGCGTYQPIAEESTCEPFSLVFGPFKLVCSDLTCNLCWDALTPGLDPSECTPPGSPCCDPDDDNFEGWYYITITE